MYSVDLINIELKTVAPTKVSKFFIGCLRGIETDNSSSALIVSYKIRYVNEEDVLPGGLAYESARQHYQENA